MSCILLTKMHTNNNLLQFQYCIHTAWWGLLVSIFAGCVPLVSQNPIVVYFVAIFIPILITFGHYSLFLVYFVADNKPNLSHFWSNDFLTLSPEKVRPYSSNSIENAWKGDPIIVSRVVKMQPHLAAHPQQPTTRKCPSPWTYSCVEYFQKLKRGEFLWNVDLMRVGYSFQSGSKGTAGSSKKIPVRYSRTER